MGFFDPIKLWLNRGGKAPADSEERSFREMAETSSDMICRIGADGSGKYFSPASETLFGWTPAEMCVMPPDRFFYAEDLPILNASTERLLSGASKMERCQVRVRHRDGTTMWVETRTRVASAAEGSGDMIVVLRDISERKLLEDRLEALALTDGLTGVANRRAFDIALDQGWKDTLAKGSRMSLLLLDIDQFKRFNDHFGHQVGDDCLRTVAAAVRGAVTAADANVARFGGEEFAVVLPHAEAHAAAALAEAVRAAVQAMGLPHPGNADCGGHVTVSIGAATAMAQAGGTMTMPAGLLQAADMALYKAKHNGRNRVETSLLLTSGESG